MLDVSRRDAPVFNLATGLLFRKHKGHQNSPKAAATIDPLLSTTE